METEDLEKLKAIEEVSKQEPLQPEEDYFTQESVKFNKFIIENDKELLPEEIKSMFWAFNDKELALTNFDNEDIKRGLLWFDIAKIDVMMGMPDYKLTFQTMRNIDEARFKTLAKMKRSFGGMERERALLATQIKDIRTTERKPGQGGGILGGFFRMFGGGR